MSEATSGDSLSKNAAIKSGPAESRSRGVGAVPLRAVRGLWTAIRFLLLAGDPGVHDPAVWRWAARWFVPVGFLIGLAWTSWFSTLWWKFGEIERIRIIPAMGVVLLDVTLLGYKYFRSTIVTLGALVDKRRRECGVAPSSSPADHLPVTVGIILLLMIKFALIVSIPTTHQWWPSDWRRHFLWLYPATVYRPLILAPAWMAWGTLLAAAIGRVSGRPESGVGHLGRVVRPSLIFGWFLVLAAISAVYCSHHRDTEVVGAILSLIVFGLTFFASAGLARALGGQTQDTVFTAGQLTQLLFLAGFLAFGPYVFG